MAQRLNGSMAIALLTAFMPLHLCALAPLSHYAFPHSPVKNISLRKLSAEKLIKLCKLKKFSHFCIAI